MNLILAAEGSELHAHQRFQTEESEGWCRFRFCYVGGRQQTLGPDLFASVEYMKRIARLRARPIEKHVDARRVPVDEAGVRQCLLGRLQVSTPDNDVHVPGVA